MENIVLSNNNSVNRFGIKPCFLESTVINDKVTYKIHYALNLTDDQIRKAGKSGLKFSDGVLVNKRGLFISDDYSGKMKNMPAISGYAGNNELCIKRALKGYSVCAHCYSLIGIWKTCIPAYTKNDLIFSTEIFQPGDLILDPQRFPYFRYSTHGDTMNALDVRNKLLAARDNPNTQFSLWTKNLRYWRSGLRMYKQDFGEYHKPKNLFVLFSPLHLDYFPNEDSFYFLKQELEIDAIFAVYKSNESHAKAISQGAWSCQCDTGSCRWHCRFCYDRLVREQAGYAESNKAIWVAEILDGSKHKE